MRLDFADVFFVVNLFDRIGHGIVGREEMSEIVINCICRDILLHFRVDGIELTISNLWILFLLVFKLQIS